MVVVVVVVVERPVVVGLADIGGGGAVESGVEGGGIGKRSVSSVSCQLVFCISSWRGRRRSGGSGQGVD